MLHALTNIAYNHNFLKNQGVPNQSKILGFSLQYKVFSGFQLVFFVCICNFSDERVSFDKLLRVILYKWSGKFISSFTKLGSKLNCFKRCCSIEVLSDCTSCISGCIKEVYRRKKEVACGLCNDVTSATWVARGSKFSVLQHSYKLKWKGGGFGLETNVMKIDQCWK